jgi:hypothetical protein
MHSSCRTDLADRLVFRLRVRGFVIVAQGAKQIWLYWCKIWVEKKLDQGRGAWSATGQNAWKKIQRDSRSGCKESGYGYSTASLQSFNHIKDWIHTCRSSHKLCNELASNLDRWKPTRLLDLSGKARIIVRARDDIPPNSEYLAESVRAWAVSMQTWVELSWGWAEWNFANVD